MVNTGIWILKIFFISSKMPIKTTIPPNTKEPENDLFICLDNYNCKIKLKHDCQNSVMSMLPTNIGGFGT